MNRGLWNKAIREIWLVTLLCGAGMMAFEALISYIFWTYQEQLTGELGQIEFVRDMISSLVGGKVTGPIGPASLRALAWVHPLVLGIAFAQVITVATRVPSGEVDRGTADILFALPVPRWRLQVTEILVSLSSVAVVLLVALGGSLAGYRFVPPEGRPELIRLVGVVINLFCLSAAISAVSMLLSTLSDRRSRAVGSAFGIVMTFLLWSFLAQYWEPADRVMFLNLLSYFQPMPILDAAQWPLRHGAILLAVAASGWIAAGFVLHRRDICTV